ncbi:transmembrane protein 223-like [Ctenocephalides felis]|uniref:transmembrane protein 223-like n=1 Tax=Ctenocephalides felis TaxID=7515 RepID=UPI000E6E55DA|nr:transmembrane protein 223-like [Ctenocephalides felis]
MNYLLYRNITCPVIRTSINQYITLQKSFITHANRTLKRTFHNSPSILLFNQRNFSISSITRQQLRAYDVNTNVTKDIILYKYENPRFFTLLNGFAICQFVFWVYLGHFAYTCLRDAPLSEQAGDVAWWRKINLGENKYKNTLAALCVILGYGILGVSWVYTLRSVRYLILKKGGKSISLVTYSPVGKSRILTVDLKNVSCNQPREHSLVQLPLKVKDKYFYYLLDMKGEFKNVRLFDYTAGLKRLL